VYSPLSIKHTNYIQVISQPRKNILQIPTCNSVAEQRLYLQQCLAAAYRLFSRFGSEEGIGGHITAHDPENPEHFRVKTLGLHFGLIRVSDLILVNQDGEVIYGDSPVNRAAFTIHSQVHTGRTDVIATAHTHSMVRKKLVYPWSSP
jgi:ribulose-5-phosphate 4-epimerase/fuculose-1-phosphate aldolase